MAGSPYQMTGVPDVLVLVAGKLVGLEVKFQRAGETVEHAKSRVSPAQLLQISRIKAAGGTAGVVVSVAEALELVALALGSVEEE